MTRMFSEITKTFNPYIGCKHLCSYCWARDLALGRLKDTPRYSQGFEPRLVEEELSKRFRNGLVFVSDMGDLWGDWVDREDILRVLEVVRASPGATFLMLTKNPGRYLSFLEEMPENVILGATIESNRHYREVSAALGPWLRYWAMKSLPSQVRKMVSIEPIMDFDLWKFPFWIQEIAPEFIYIGYDNHSKGLKEPGVAKTLTLIRELEKFTEVRKKTLREPISGRDPSKKSPQG